MSYRDGSTAAVTAYALEGGDMTSTSEVARRFDCHPTIVNRVKRKLRLVGAMPEAPPPKDPIEHMRPNPGWDVPKSPPPTRAGCETIARPCDRTLCRYWLPAGPQGCALDHADEGPTPNNAETGRRMMLTKNRVSQIVREASAAARDAFERGGVRCSGDLADQTFRGLTGDDYAEAE